MHFKYALYQVFLYAKDEKKKKFGVWGQGDKGADKATPRIMGIIR